MTQPPQPGCTGPAGWPGFQKPWEAGVEPHHNFPLGDSVQGVATDSEA